MSFSRADLHLWVPITFVVGPMVTSSNRAIETAYDQGTGLLITLPAGVPRYMPEYSN